MDQVKIGRFIAERRKSKGLTQAQLAERFGISDRAVSKWENGRSLPDASLMLDLCAVLDITVNDLLNGEVVTMENYNKELENTLLEMVKQKEENDRKLLALEWVVGGLSVLVILLPAIFAAYVSGEEWVRVLISLSGFIPGLIGFFFALKIEQTAGFYECSKCGHRYVPSFKAVMLAPHMGRTRQLRCPECGKISWSKKRISKN